MILWRIAAETRDYGADDLSGTGAAKSPGRWNLAGEKVLYTAPTISLAVLETLAYVDSGGFPLNRFLVRIHLPDAAWKKRQVCDMATLSPAWSSIPSSLASATVGSRWLKQKAAPLVLSVPSVIVPEEYTAILNPEHPDMRGVSAEIVRKYEYNVVLRHPKKT
jgi:RES domain-containing protein